SYTLLYWFHILCALYLMFFFSVSFYWKQDLKKRASSQQELPKSWWSLYYATRITIYVLILIFLAGGKMGTPFFKAKSLWIFIKLGTWLVLIMAVYLFGSRGLKQVKLGMTSQDKILVQKGIKSLDLFMPLGLILFVTACVLGYIKPF
ncbi:MAG: hypothetical protein D6785_16470, partial [Planctomycetota bacterium]